jgi:hypothetical protein
MRCVGPDGGLAASSASCFASSHCAANIPAGGRHWAVATAEPVSLGVLIEPAPVSTCAAWRDVRAARGRGQSVGPASARAWPLIAKDGVVIACEFGDMATVLSRSRATGEAYAEDGASRRCRRSRCSRTDHSTPNWQP